MNKIQKLIRYAKMLRCLCHDISIIWRGFHSDWQQVILVVFLLVRGIASGQSCFCQGKFTSKQGEEGGHFVHISTPFFRNLDNMHLGICNPPPSSLPSMRNAQ